MAYEDELAKVWIFSSLERSDLGRIANAVIPRTYEKGETIVTEGERAVAFYAIIKGRVDVTKEGKRLDTMSSGGCFGEMSLLDGHPRSASLVAVEDTECLVMTHWDFTAELRTSPSMCLAILSELSKRIRRLEGEDIP